MTGEKTLSAKERRWVLDLLSVSAFNHERASMSCLNALEANAYIFGPTIMYSGATSGFKLQTSTMFATKRKNCSVLCKRNRKFGFKMKEKAGCSDVC